MPKYKSCGRNVILKKRKGLCDFCSDEERVEKEIVSLEEKYLLRQFCEDCLKDKFLRAFKSNTKAKKKNSNLADMEVVMEGFCGS